jgi:hypothetical protein
VIIDEYAYVQKEIRDDREYLFAFPSVGADAIRVYEIEPNAAPVLVRQQDYTLTFGSAYRDPLKYNGRVVFNREHGAQVTHVRITRNTYIDQTVDFRRHDPFNTRMIENALDKLTMIAQEISDRKCDAGLTAINQQVVFGSYWAITAGQLNRSLDKITDILFRIDQKGQDCRPGAAPEGKTP